MLFFRQFAASISSVTGLELNVQEVSQASYDKIDDEMLLGLHERIETLEREVRHNNFYSQNLYLIIDRRFWNSKVRLHRKMSKSIH